MQEGKVTKDTIKLKYSLGYGEDGAQTYFVGLIGYGERNGDTTWVDQPKIIEKIEKPFTFYYRDGEFDYATKKVRDTTFFYYTTDTEEHNGYAVVKKGEFVEEYDYFLNTKKRYYNRITSKDKTHQSVFIDETYAPSETFKEIYNDIELARKAAEIKATYISEEQFDFYDSPKLTDK